MLSAVVSHQAYYFSICFAYKRHTAKARSASHERLPGLSLDIFLLPLLPGQNPKSRNCPGGNRDGWHVLLVSYSFRGHVSCWGGHFPPAHVIRTVRRVHWYGDMLVAHDAIFKKENRRTREPFILHAAVVKELECCGITVISHF